MTSYVAAVETPERQRAVAADYDAARADRDAALKKLHALAPANGAPKAAFPQNPPRTPPRSAVRFEATPLGTIVERGSERGSEDVKKDDPPKKKKGLLAKIRRGVARRIGGNTTKPRAWEVASRTRKPPPQTKPSKKKKNRLSEQPFAPCDFERRRILGRGGFGVVYLVEKKLDGRNYAMKVLDKSKLLKGGQRSQARLERDVLRIVKHPFVARLRLSFQTETRLYLLSDFYCGGSLGEFSREHTITKAGARFYVSELALALSYLHVQGVVHRDLKPANVLVDRQGHVALCDFGIAAACAETMKTTHKKRGSKTPATPRRRSFCGTIDYMAPELLRGEAYDDSVDWWALGCVFHELLTGSPPFSRDRPRDMFCAILREAPPSLIVKCGVECADAVSGLLKKQSADRFGMALIKGHAFFSGVDWGAVEAKSVAPPHAPLLKSYLAEDAQGIMCVATGSLPRLNADGESSDDEPRTRNTAPQNAFSGFAYAGDENETPTRR